MGRVSMILVMSFVMSISAYLTTLSSSQKTVLKTYIQTDNAIEAHNVSNSFAHYCLRYLEKHNGWRTGLKNQKIKNSDAVCSVKIDDSSTNSKLQYGEILITSVASIQNPINNATVRCTTYAMQRAVPFSQYALFAGHFPSGLYFGTGEKVDGPVHVNGAMGVMGVPGPIFTDNVSSTSGVSYAGGANQYNFKGFQGTNNDFHHDNIPLPNNMGLTNAARSKAYRVPNGYNYLEMKANGTVILSKDSWYSASYGSHIKTLSVYNINEHNGGIILAPHDIHIKGTLKGRLSIASDQHIIADENITYANDPRTDISSTDMLGLMSAQDFTIGTSHTAYNDSILIMANIFTKGSIKIENYAGIGQRGHFTVYGSRTQRTLSATYTTRVYYTAYQFRSIYDYFTHKNYNYVYNSWRQRANGRGHWEYDIERRRIKYSSYWGYKKRYFDVVVGKHWVGDAWSGYKEQIVYDNRFRKWAPPGTPYTNDEKKLAMWNETF